jgi:hypothetical protein
MPYQPTYPRDPYTVGTTTFYSNTDRHAPPEYETIEMNELAPVDTPSSQPTTQESRRRPSDLQVGARRRRIGRNELPEPATQPDAQPDAQPARRWLPTFRWSEREDGTETLENARESILFPPRPKGRIVLTSCLPYNNRMGDTPLYHHHLFFSIFYRHHEHSLQFHLQCLLR